MLGIALPWRPAWLKHIKVMEEPSVPIMASFLVAGGAFMSAALAEALESTTAEQIIIDAFSAFFVLSWAVDSIKSFSGKEQFRRVSLSAYVVVVVLVWLVLRRYATDWALPLTAVAGGLTASISRALFKRSRSNDHLAT